MANRHNHYEAAFEAFLRDAGLPYVAVDEARRSRLPDGGTLKNLDFIVSGRDGTSWLVDVKGRRFPSGEEQRHYWKNWSTRDDLESLAQWEELFGRGFAAMFVFAYEVLFDRAPLPAEELFRHRQRRYGFIGLPRAEYACLARPISAKWETLAMPAADFRRLARPLRELLGLPPAAPPTAPPVVEAAPAAPG